MLTTQKIHSIAINKKHFQDDTDGINSQRYHIIAEFEIRMASLVNFICHECNSMFIDYANNRKVYKCKLCQQDKKNDKRIKYQQPSWINRQLQVKNEIPLQLQNLNLGEKLLIQKYSPYIPIIHIRYGVLAMKGHCICFPKDVISIYKTLPRIDCQVVRYIRHYGTKHDDITENYDQFTVRKHKVMDALMWLKEYNPLYKKR